MYRETRGVDPQFDKLAGTDVPLDDIWRDVEVLRILGVHDDTIHQLVIVGELLRVELFLQCSVHSRSFHSAIETAI